MKFATAKEHRVFFQKQGWIEFEGLLSNEQLTLANQAIDQILTERLKTTPDQLNLVSSEDLFVKGHDLWRSHAVLRKLATHVRFAEIAAELTEKKSLRLGYDQLFVVQHPFQISQQEPPLYSDFLSKTLSLEAVSCLSEVECGLLFALGGQEDSISETKAEGIDVFPHKAGQAIFIHPHLPIQWKNLYAHVNQRFYLIVYSALSARYQLQVQDPHTHDLKRLGYVFNDKLNDKLHPIVYR